MRDGAGSDSYKLRGGGDTFLAVKDDFRSPGTDLADHVDGGTGVDTYVLNYTGTGSIFVVNLDSKVHLSVDGHSAFQLFGPTDTVLNFENVTGSASVDDIFGTSGANRIDGGAGADQIAGLGGRDVLTGGDDDDTFVFTRASDSGVTAAKRDVITDFRPSLDKIDLTAIETAAGHNFVFKDVGPFDHTSCELRETYNGGNTIIWGDVNGDNKADFSIALQGHWLLEQSDFL